MRRPSRRFIFRLALALGRSVQDLSDNLTSAELSEWMAFDLIEPIGGRRGDVHAGIVASTVANALSGKNRRFKVEDFIVFPPKSRTAQSRVKTLATKDVEDDIRSFFKR